ncbi:MAG: hypothetical protein ABI970_14490 [Chloroflexota bacterium]
MNKAVLIQPFITIRKQDDDISLLGVVVGELRRLVYINHEMLRSYFPVTISRTILMFSSRDHMPISGFNVANKLLVCWANDTDFNSYTFQGYTILLLADIEPTRIDDGR